MSLCTDAKNCSSSGVFRECYKENNFRDDIFFCECSNWHGWVGENCNTPSATTYFFGFSFFFFLSWTLFNIFTLSNVLYIFVNGNKVRGRDTNPAFFVALLAFIGSLCLLIRFMIRSQAFYDPTFFEIAEGDSLIFSGSNTLQRKFFASDNLMFLAAWIYTSIIGLFTNDY